jgi:AraC-like DNA-binding protein
LQDWARTLRDPARLPEDQRLGLFLVMKLEGEAVERLQAVAAQIRRHAPEDGEIATVVPGFTLFRASTPTLVRRGILRPSFCVVVQGEKVAQAGAHTELRYRPWNFVATSIDMPVAGQVVVASTAKPYLAASFELTPHDVLQVLTDAKIQVDTTAPSTPAAFVGTCDARLLGVVLRAVASLDDEREAKFMGPLLRKELIYHLVTGPSAFAVCQSALLARSDDGVGRAVDWIKTHFKDPLSIQVLAKQSNMSASSLQHKFKAMAAATTTSITFCLHSRTGRSSPQENITTRCMRRSFSWTARCRILLFNERPLRIEGRHPLASGRAPRPVVTSAA